MIDTHCHLTFPQLHDQVKDVIARAKGDGVDRMISIGTTVPDAYKARDLARQYDAVFFACGIHPHYSQEIDGLESTLKALLELGQDLRCAAFGEMGLDYHYDDPPRAYQHEVFEAQLAMVKQSGLDDLPVILHCRKAVDDALVILKNSGLPGERFVFHCFTETPEDAKKVLDFGAMISFTGIATYKNAPEVRESNLLVPSDRMMLETDAPFLSPEPHRKIRPNEPRFVTATARYLAELRGVSYQDLVEQCDANAERFFRLTS